MARQPATTACPRAKPPSLVGTTRWVSTPRSRPLSSARAKRTSSTFWKTPPLSATCCRPVCLVQTLGRIGDHAGHGDVEAGRDGAHRDAPAAIIDHALPYVVNHQFFAHEIEGVVPRRLRREGRPTIPARWPPALHRRPHGGRRAASSPHRRGDPCSMSERTAPRVRAAAAARPAPRPPHAAPVADRRPRRSRRPTDGPMRRGRACGWWRPRREAGRSAGGLPARSPVVAGDQDLAAPDGAIGAVTGAIEGEADDPLVPRDPVFRHDCRDVGVVVLDQRQRSVAALIGPASGLVARVGVGGHTLGIDLVHLLELDGRTLEGGAGSPGCPCRRCAGSSRHRAQRPGRRCS